MTTCQICGREIKARNGLIAKHGYRVPRGREGDHGRTKQCYGSDCLPYEVSRCRIEYAVCRYTDARESAEEALLELWSNPPATLSRPGKVGRRLVTVTVDRPDGFVRGQYQGLSRYNTIYRTREHELKMSIKDARETVSFLCERFDAWVPPAENAA
jgi:hypothetical protein